MGLLDQTSYSFSDPDGRDLFDMLVGLYRADRARFLALRAGVPVTTISFRTDVDAWQDLLPVAARSGRLRALAVVIMADDESVQCVTCSGVSSTTCPPARRVRSVLAGPCPAGPSSTASRCGIICA